MPTDTRPVEPTMSLRLKVSVDSACRSALNDPYTTPAPIKPATTPTNVAPPALSPKLCTPSRPPMPNMATKPRSIGVGDTPPRSKPRWMAARKPPKRSSKMSVSSRRPPPSTRQPPKTRSAVLICLSAASLQAGEKGFDQAPGAWIRAVDGAHLVHHVAERDAQAGIGEADRTAAAVVAKGTFAGHGPER